MQIFNKNDFHSLAIEFQYIQRRRLIENSLEGGVGGGGGGGGGDDNSVAVGAPEIEQVQRQPVPRRIPEIIDSLSTLFNKSLSVILSTLLPAFVLPLKHLI